MYICSVASPPSLPPPLQNYADLLKGTEAQYNRLMEAGSGLASNEMVGGRTAIREEMDALRMKWGPLKDNITDSLDLLVRLGGYRCRYKHTHGHEHKLLHINIDCALLLTPQRNS